ncbi:MAG: quinone-dependent dihydroorotate dehydrogenase [Parafilimonas sp.]
MMYRLLRNLLFAFPPEDVHHFSMNMLHKASKINLTKNIIQNSFQFKNNALQKEVFGLTFKNPVGVGAGFDKNALYLPELELLGFGFVEIGTVTPLPQQGNEKPRLFRLPKDKALINRMGFNNDGVKAVRKRLEDWNNCKLRTVNCQLPTANGQRPTVNSQLSTVNCQLIIGGNMGKNKATPNDDAWKDYEICFNELFDCADYFVVNVSSPNTPRLRELQQKESLKKILSHLQTINHGKNKSKPLLLKISPDLNAEQLDDIIAIALEIKLDGFVATNTTITRNQLKTENWKLETVKQGGLSGQPLKKLSTEVVSYLSHQTENKIPIIASGGIFSGADAQEKIDAGASLLQVWTGFIYEGPSIVKNICTHLSSH